MEFDHISHPYWKTWKRIKNQKATCFLFPVSQAWDLIIFFIITERCWAPRSPNRRREERKKEKKKTILSSTQRPGNLVERIGKDIDMALAED